MIYFKDVSDLVLTRRKGRLQEILSKALHADDPKLYTVSYRDFESSIEIPLLEFIRKSEHFELIPSSRITCIKRGDTILYLKSAI